MRKLIALIAATLAALTITATPSVAADKQPQSLTVHGVTFGVTGMTATLKAVAYPTGNVGTITSTTPATCSVLAGPDAGGNYAVRYNAPGNCVLHVVAAGNAKFKKVDKDYTIRVWF